VRLRSELHERGLRFRKDLLVRVGSTKVHPDIVFTRARVAVFVDGCFWHGCPEHQTVPKRNPEYWVPKLKRNVERDRESDAALSSEHWAIVRVWEHEDVATAGERIENLVRRPAPAR
jgi:DNA mismatch endonuclease (patch repair protein)